MYNVEKQHLKLPCDYNIRHLLKHLIGQLLHIGH